MTTIGIYLPRKGDVLIREKISIYKILNLVLASKVLFFVNFIIISLKYSEKEGFCE
jgi:hypothetical protein